MTQSRSLMLALAACGVLAAACMQDDTAVTDTAAGAVATPAPATPSTPTLTDANIVYILDQANASDSARGKLAETKGTDAEVKQFGRMMMGEHHALRLSGANLASRLGVTPTPPAADDSEAMAKAEMDSLTAMPKGRAWDKAYIDYEVTFHQAVLDKATQALGAAQNAELKTLIEGAAPVIQKHLDMAKQIQGKLQ